MEVVIYLELPDYLIGYNHLGIIYLNQCLRGTLEGLHYLKRLGLENIVLEFDGDSIIRREMKKTKTGGSKVAVQKLA